jgi:hypothetical protein
MFVQCDALILCKDRADLPVSAPVLPGDRVKSEKPGIAINLGEIASGRMILGRITLGKPALKKDRAMKLTIEIVAAALLVFCLTATSAAFAAGKTGRSADGLSCSFSVAKSASPAARCAAIRSQCGGKFVANACGDKMLSAVN